MTEPLLTLEDVTVSYPGRRRRRDKVDAVTGIDLDIAPGEAVGLVGESGSGKSTIGRAVLGLAEVTRGHIRFEGRDITNPTTSQRKRLATEVQVVFQDPYGSLNPTLTIGQTLAEPLRAQGGIGSEDRRRRVYDVLEQVGLPRDAAERYPRQFSGGQRQRIAIARALILKPRLIICDEPVSALDLSIQAQILNLLEDLRTRTGVAYLFISHDLAVVRHVTTRCLVLYRGRIVEEGATQKMHRAPHHPYTQTLLAAEPGLDGTLARPPAITGADVTDGDGCAFAPRCPNATPLCRRDRPRRRAMRVGSAAACHHPLNHPATEFA